jgi:hypothetical protein
VLVLSRRTSTFTIDVVIFKVALLHARTPFASARLQHHPRCIVYGVASDQVLVENKVQVAVVGTFIRPIPSAVSKMHQET